MSDIQIVHPGYEPMPGPAGYFTGGVSVASPFKGTGGARLGGATVTFQPGEHVQAMAPGDVVWIAHSSRHWHGAARDSAMTHVAVAGTRTACPSRGWNPCPTPIIVDQNR